MVGSTSLGSPSRRSDAARLLEGRCLSNRRAGGGGERRGASSLRRTAGDGAKILEQEQLDTVLPTARPVTE